MLPRRLFCYFFIVFLSAYLRGRSSQNFDTHSMVTQDYTIGLEIWGLPWKRFIGQKQHNLGPKFRGSRDHGQAPFRKIFEGIYSDCLRNIAVKFEIRTFYISERLAFSVQKFRVMWPWPRSKNFKGTCPYCQLSQGTCFLNLGVAIMWLMTRDPMTRSHDI